MLDRDYPCLAKEENIEEVLVGRFRSDCGGLWGGASNTADAGSSGAPTTAAGDTQTQATQAPADEPATTEAPTEEPAPGGAPDFGEFDGFAVVTVGGSRYEIDLGNYIYDYGSDINRPSKCSIVLGQNAAGSGTVPWLLAHGADDEGNGVELMLSSEQAGIDEAQIVIGDIPSREVWVAAGAGFRESLGLAEGSSQVDDFTNVDSKWSGTATFFMIDWDRDGRWRVRSRFRARSKSNVKNERVEHRIVNANRITY